MVWGSGAKFIKCLVISVNFVAMLAGAAILTAGAAGLINSGFAQQVAHLVPAEGLDDLRHVFYLAIIVGGATMIIGFIGCAGAVCENRCLLGSLICILALLLIVQLVAGILAFVYENEGAEEIRHQLRRSAANLDSLPERYCEAWTQLQTQWNCCGPDGGPIIAKCFNESTTYCGESKGVACSEIFIGFVRQYGTIVGGVVIGFIALELLSIFLACFLCLAIRRDKLFGDTLDITYNYSSKRGTVSEVPTSWSTKR